MLNAASPIQAPSDAVLAEVFNLLETKSVVSGPILSFDRERRVFLVALVEQGVIVHWSLHSCPTDTDAEAMQRRYAAGLEALAKAQADCVQVRTH